MRLTNITAHDAAGTPTGTQLSEQCLRQVLFDVLQQNVLCSIATVTPDGRPHINTAYFCYSDELELYFLSHPHSVHSQNLSTNSAAAMAIFSSAQQWATRDVGVQLFGTGIVAEGAAAMKAEELYGNRFPGYADWKASRSGNLDAEYRFYRFVVLRVKFSTRRISGMGWGDRFGDDSPRLAPASKNPLYSPAARMRASNPTAHASYAE